MLSALTRMGNQLPPKLKALLNLAITLVLIVIGVPLAWIGGVVHDWSNLALGLGLVVLGIFNLFT